MCGRFILLIDLSLIAGYFQIGEVSSEYNTGCNVCPGEQISAVIRNKAVNKLVNFRLGLNPSWAKDPSIGCKMINARAETIAEEPSFKDAFKRRRCLIPITIQCLKNELVGSDTEKVKIAQEAYQGLLDGFYEEHQDMMIWEQYEAAKNDPDYFLVLIQLAYHYQDLAIVDNDEEQSLPYMNWKLFTQI
jgi:hypothetical protein